VTEAGKYTAVIFDMDGVLVDSELHWKKLEGFFLQSLVPTWSAGDQGKIIGLSVHDLYSMLTTDYGLQKSKEEFLDLYHVMARDIYTVHVSLIEPFPRLLADLKARAVPVALASSSPRAWIDMMLERFSLAELFTEVVSSDELQGKGKPAPDIYLLTAQRLGVPPEQCLVIEDSRNGVLSAKAAGMYCIGFRNGFNEEQDLSDADILLDSAAAISDLVLGLLEDKKKQGRA
jgi:HAD superfamily hydrolase (TIGR01509 family)